MRTVRQRDDSNECGVACTAMLAGKTYDEARAVIVDIIGEKVLEQRGISARRICEALEKLGRKPVKTRLTSLEEQAYRHLNSDALLKKEGHKPHLWHWMVWDAKYKKVRDPDRNGPRRHVGVIAYLEVNRAYRT